MADIITPDRRPQIATVRPGTYEKKMAAVGAGAPIISIWSVPAGGSGCWSGSGRKRNGAFRNTGQSWLLAGDLRSGGHIAISKAGRLSGCRAWMQQGFGGEGMDVPKASDWPVGKLYTAGSGHYFWDFRLCAVSGRFEIAENDDCCQFRSQGSHI